MFLWGLVQCLLPLLEEEKKKKRKKKEASLPKAGKKLILRPQKWGRSSVYQEIDPLEVSCREKSGSAQALLISLREKEILEQCWSQLNRVAFSTPQGKSWPHQRAIDFFNTKKSDNCNPRLRNKVIWEGKKKYIAQKVSFMEQSSPVILHIVCNSHIIHIINSMYNI